MPNIVKTFATTLTVLACMASTTLAQASSAADKKEIAAYRLTTASLAKIKQAVRLAADAEAKSPKVRAQIKLQSALDSLRKKDELSDAEQARLEKLEEQLAKAEDDDEGELQLSDDETISQIEKKVSAHKPIADALRQVGMTPREYAVWTMAYLEAAMAMSLKQTGHARDIPRDANLANVKFLEDHIAEIKALQEEYERASRKSP